MTAKLRDKLVKALALLESDQDGEVMGAAKAIVRIVRSAGATFDDVVVAVIGAANVGGARPTATYTDEAGSYHKAWDDLWENQPAARDRYEQACRDSTYRQEPNDYVRFKRSQWRQMAEAIYEYHKFDLTDWEEGFIASISRLRNPMLTDNQWKVLLRIAKKLEATAGY